MLARQRTQVCDAVSQRRLGLSSAHSASLLHWTQVLPPVAHTVSLLAAQPPPPGPFTQSTQVSALEHWSLVALGEQPSSSNGSHVAHWPSLVPEDTHTELLVFASQAALLTVLLPSVLHATQVCVVGLQMGAAAVVQFALVKQATHVLVAVSQNLPGSSLQWAFVVHCTQRPLPPGASSHVVLV